MFDNRFYHVSPDGRMTRMASLDQALSCRGQAGYLWLNFETPTREELESLARPLGLHPLAIEDCLNEDQVPKIEDFTENTFILFNRYRYSGQQLLFREVDFFLGRDFLVSVSAPAADPLDRQRLDEAVRIKEADIGHGPDYLLHLILDYIVDDKLLAIEALQEDLDGIEENMIQNPSSFRPEEVLRLRKNLLALRKSITHEREILVKICRRDSPFISEKAIYHFRDISDHLVKFAEVAEICREMISNLMEVYLSLMNNQLGNIGNRTNQVVRRLTFINTIFMPLTLLAGIGGMSEWTMMTGPSNWAVAYPVFLGLMAVVGTASYRLLRRLDSETWAPPRTLTGDPEAR